MEQNYIEEAIPLVEITDDNKFKINPSALDILKTIQSPLVILGVAGLYRTGKSYLLNRVILNREKGFGVAPTINSCTKGIWMWGKPIKGQTEDGKIVNIIILDSEGLGAIDRDSSHDCRIFALVLLLSSFFLYNSTGAIDENSIDNLSLVINLTKHIRIKANESEEEDCEDFSKFFPSFLWILRDFSLQLKDEFGDNISSKEYLDNSIKLHNGISDEIQKKNRIRRVITQFFKDRDCYTLVRPLLNEEDLNKLEEIKMEDLRPEFVEQVLTLRKKILTTNKIKKINDKEINGEMLSGLIVSYINAINNGAVPNIENAWNYICINQCIKLKNECLNYFKENLQSIIFENMPLSEKFIKEEYLRLKKYILEKFQKELMLKNNKKYITELNFELKKIKNDILEDNNQEFEMILLNILNTNYNEMIYNKLIDNKYKGIEDFTKDINIFKDKFFTLEPDGPLKKERILNFLINKSLEGLEIMTKNIENKNLEFVHELKTKNIKFEGECENLKTFLEQEKNNSEKTIKDLESELYENMLKIKNLEINNLNINNEFEEYKKIKTKEISTLEEDFKTEVETLKNNKNLENEEKLKFEKKFFEEKSNYETEIALLQQKLDFYKNFELENNERLKNMFDRQNKLEQKNNEKIERIKKEYESEIQNLNNIIKNFKNEQYDFEEKINNRNLVQESMCHDFEEKENELKTYINQHEMTILSLQNQLKEPDSNDDLENILLKKDKIIEDLEKTLKNIKLEYKEKNDEMKLNKIYFNKEIELLTQNEDFYKIKLKDMEDEIEELKKIKDNTLNVLQNNNINKEDSQKQIYELKSNFEVKMKSFLEEFEIEKEEIIKKYSSLLEKEELSKKEIKIKKEKLQKNIFTFKEEINLLKNENGSLLERCKNLETQKEKTISDLDNYYKIKFKKYESEIENIKIEKENEINDLNNLLNKNMINLREVFEKDKINLEMKLNEQKLKYKNILEKTVNELEKKYTEEIESNEEDLISYQNELNEKDRLNNEFLEKYKTDTKRLNDKILILESRENRYKTKMENLLEKEKEKLSLIENRFKEEKKLSNKENEKQKQLLSERNAELYQLKQKIENFRNSNQNLKKENEKLIENLQLDNINLKKIIDKLDQSKYILNEEYMNFKIQNNKELALSNQKNEFNERKIKELKNTVESIQNENGNKIKKIISNLEKENSNIKKNLKEELSNWESKYLEKKKNLKEVENKLNHKILELEKSKYSLTEKLNISTEKNSEMEKKLTLEIESYISEINNLKENNLYEKKNLMNNVDSLRKEKYDLEINLAETQAKYDKDKAVYDGKISFLDQQNKKLKIDLAEHQNQFDMMFQKFHNYRLVDKEETESSHNAYIETLENRYNAQIQDLKEQNKYIVDNLKEKIRNLEKEIKKLEIENNSMLDKKYGNNIIQEKKINELLNNEKKLQKEIMILRSQKDNLTLGFQKELEKEKDLFKNKIYKIENKCKKLENDKYQFMFEQEKNKTQWYIEKDRMMSELNDKLETIDKLDKQKYQLIKENEKIKGNLKTLRKANFGSSFFLSTKNKNDIFGDKNSIVSSREFLNDTYK